MTTTDHTDVHRAQPIADIRALADFLEEHPDAGLPRAFEGSRHVCDPCEFARAVQALGDDGVLEVRNGYVTVTLRFGTVKLGVQTLVEELLGEQQPPPDQTARVRQALDNLVDDEEVSANG